MIPPKCEQELSLPCYFFDVNKNLRPASFFDLAQEIAVQGSAMVGAPDWVLKDRDIAWILSRMHVRFEQYPRLYDKVLLQTWHSGISGPLYTRDYLMLNADGNVLIRATSSWILMEISTRSITRVDRIFDLMSPEPQCDGRALDANAPKLYADIGKKLSEFKGCTVAILAPKGACTENLLKNCAALGSPSTKVIKTSHGGISLNCFVGKIF